MPLLNDSGQGRPDLMVTIDSQVHCYERNHPGRPWTEVLAGPPEVTGADMVKAMDAVGVDGGLLTSVFAMYRYDASYASRGTARWSIAIWRQIRPIPSTPTNSMPVCSF